ncbi:SDR family oxidoreductase [Luteibacter sp. PPL201]|uniref:SDR family oxidoreductase n=1 Tax=Luteibacter sahnii TaxID=3021977 RepID=A0ABT6BB44_9GAMM|nr:SDR family oxidoreductase [Luteibacter sp. PPL193]MDY1547333.1 SDR family oxidoreductase [Luteibacter sp. PPL193]
MDLRLTGRHALVCGASQGIGRATAFELAQLGASVTLLARSGDALKALAAELPAAQAGQTHRHVVADMLDTEALVAAVGEVVGDHAVHIVVNNSGGPPGGPISAATPDALLTTYRQHLVSAQVVVQACLPGMRQARYGRVVNVISTSVKEPIPNLGVSNTVRAAVAAWAKTMSVEVAADGITVNNVLPGYTRTARLASIIDAGMQAGRSREDVERGMLAGVPAARFGDPAEVAALIAFLASPAAGYVNGTSIAVDGGRTRSLS